jgi:hypothetical protein
VAASCFELDIAFFLIISKLADKYILLRLPVQNPELHSVWPFRQAFA